MNKLIIISVLCLSLLVGNSAFASTNQSKVLDAVDYKIENAIAPLQAQVNALEAKNRELESKIAAQNIQPQVNTVANSADPVQDQRIDKLETKVGVLEKAFNGLKAAIDKTIGLLEKLLKLF